MAAPWVDFGALKQSVGIERVLEYYGVRLKQVHRDYLRGRCPLPGHSSAHSVESFAVNTRKNIWACHSDSCRQARNGKVGGNILDLVACMESCAIREAALRMQSWLCVEDYRQLVSKGMRADRRAEWEMPKLPFSLRLNSWHPYLDQRGISRQTAQSFGVGYYAGRGFLRGRIVFPVHNERGEVVAYAGRRLDGVGPKYPLSGGIQQVPDVISSARCSPIRAALWLRDFGGGILRLHESASGRFWERSGSDGNQPFGSSGPAAGRAISPGGRDVGWRRSWTKGGPRNRCPPVRKAIRGSGSASRQNTTGPEVQL